ncbi:efflux RND transporter periplasmic adaptor subunit [Sulfurovum sp. NBC37-1]|uniref:efflux RND transporter periplasmic adaptor subunit n=1 Tax=Sulfurovum sp. (strain NBC37-1) TaxID=387093 RepID=UPI00015877C5|nr:efflux RND transporter periplasmic adaptor subunit [Sulfurovum sp. NBC37-1]BAF71647.1 heavy metal efflux pump, CzcB family [Sulfurovum sp. NBC37-1]
MENKIFKTFILTLVLFTISAQAEMKCESGKCSTGKEATQKAIPKKPEPAKSEAMPGMTTEEHTAMLKKEATQAKKPDPKKAQEKKNRRIIEQLFNVKTVKVKRLKAAKEQVNYGYIVVEDSRRVDVVAWYEGYVEALYADTLYQKIKEGDALAKVYSPEVYKAKQDYLNSLKFNAQRSSPGMLRGAREKLRLLNISDKEIEQIRSTRKIDLYTTIYAPMSGWIFSKKINEGSSFKKQAMLFEIVNLEQVWLEAKLFQKELTKLNTLQHFTVKVEGIPTVFKARKTLLYPRLNPKEATATLRLVVDNPNEELKPGMYAKVHASGKKQTDLVIPRTAALRKDGRWYAFIATEFKGEYEPIKIELEPLDNQYFVVKKGLSEGESVVNNALFMMDSDAQINSIY